MLLVEVKSENDELSIAQELWLEWFTDAGIPAEVCHVQTSAS